MAEFRLFSSPHSLSVRQVTSYCSRSDRTWEGHNVLLAANPGAGPALYKIRKCVSRRNAFTFCQHPSPILYKALLEPILATFHLMCQFMTHSSWLTVLPPIIFLGKLKFQGKRELVPYSKSFVFLVRNWSQKPFPKALFSDNRWVCLLLLSYFYCVT